MSPGTASGALAPLVTSAALVAVSVEATLLQMHRLEEGAVLARRFEAELLEAMRHQIRSALVAGAARLAAFHIVGGEVGRSPTRRGRAPIAAPAAGPPRRWRRRRAEAGERGACSTPSAAGSDPLESRGWMI